MQFFFRSLCLLSTLVCCSQHAAAYGNLGHEIIARAAEKYLTANTQTAIQEIVPGESLVEMAWWADAMRNEHRDSSFWGYDHAANWHFVNIPPGREYDPERAAREGDIVQAITAFSDMLYGEVLTEGPIHDGLEQYRREFPDQPDPFTDKALALKLLIHFIADMHQPLHVGHGVDRGGNDIEVEWFGRNTNLHAVWDTQLIRSLEPDTDALHERIEHDLDSIPLEQIIGVADTDINVWLTEGLTYRDMVYESASAGDNLRSQYSERYGIYAKNQLLKAIVRTASTLNMLFDPDWNIADFPN